MTYSSERSFSRELDERIDQHIRLYDAQRKAELERTKTNWIMGTTLALMILATVVLNVIAALD